MGMVAAMLPNGNSSPPKRQEQGGQRSPAVPPPAPTVALPNSAKETKSSLSKVSIYASLSLALFILFQPFLVGSGTADYFITGLDSFCDVVQAKHCINVNVNLDVLLY